MGKKKLAKTALSAALVGSMILGNAASVYAWTTSDEVSDREKASAAISLEAAGEGMVLLENNGTLPVKKGAKVVVYGGGALATIKGGTGSGDVNQRNVVNVYDGLSEVYDIDNKDYWEPYMEDWAKAMAGTLTESTEYVEATRSWFSYNYKIKEKQIEDAQFRSQQDIDCAFYVVSRISGEGADRQNVKEGDGDYYLSDIERKNIEELAHYYGKVVVILNTANVMDTKFIDEINAKYADGIDAVLLMGQCGMYGGTALAQILDGEKNPSGKLVDTWPVDYMDFPSSATLGENIIDSRTEYDEYYYDDIYVGYRYFDTFNVDPAYEFGYGLSYTTFDQKIVGFSADADTVTVGVQVKNTGDTYSGKEVVEVYFSAPDGELEKPYQELAAYGKTDMLAPGESQIVTVTFNTDEMSSYDEAKAAYVLEDGDYVVRAGNSSRNTHVAGVINLKEDTITEQLSNQLPIEEGKEEKLNEKKLSNKGVESYSYEEEEEIASAKKVSLKKSAFGEAPDNSSKVDDESVVTYYSKNDAASDFAKYAAKWQLVSPIQIEQDEDGNYYVAKEAEFDRQDDATYYQYATAFPVGVTLAQIWNQELLERVGECYGDECAEFDMTYILGPGMNIHHTPLCGRNFEYYSEDPLVVGYTAASFTRGMQSKDGVGVTVKHFAGNNNETYRNYVNDVVSERALREIYLKGFEIAIKNAAPMAVMTSYNLINGQRTVNSYDLNTDILKNEWGYNGVVESDYGAANRAQANEELGLNMWANIMHSGNDWIMGGSEDGDKEMVSTNLDRMISLIEGLDASLYTEESWNAVAKVLESAKAVKTDANATQSELDAAANTLIKAFGGLKYGVQKLHLEIAVKSAEEILANAQNYNGSEGLESALEAAKTVLNDKNATQEEVNKAAEDYSGSTGESIRKCRYLLSEEPDRSG